MILTVTINPLLEYRLTYPDIRLGEGNRNPTEEYQAGGKGINVSRQLKRLGVDSLAYTFLGNFYGKKIAECLKTEELPFTSVRSSADNRLAPVVIEKEVGRATTYFGNNVELTEKEVDDFKIKLEKMIQNCEIVVFSGSSPSKSCDSIFPFGIEVANRYGKISILDTYGSHMTDCIEASPTVMHNNVSEIETSLGRILKKKAEEGIDFNLFELLSDELHAKGVKQIFLTDGKNASYFSSFGYIYRADALDIQKYTLNKKVIDATGSGDAFVSGIVYGLYKDMTFNEFSRLAVSLGGLNAASIDVCKVDKDEAFETVKHITIETIGKKLKLIDDSPTI